MSSGSLRGHDRAVARRRGGDPAGARSGRRAGGPGPCAWSRSAVRPGVPETVRLEHAVRPARSRRHLVAEWQCVWRRRPMPRLRRSRLQLRVSGVHARGTGGLRQEHPFVRTRKRQRRRQGASRRTHRQATGAAPRARQRHLRHLQSDGNAARHSLSGPGRVHRPSRSHLSAFPVGIWSPNHLDRRPEASEARGYRPAEMVGLCHQPLGRQHAGRRFDRIRRTDVGRLFRVSA